MPGTSRPRIGLTAWRRYLPTALGEQTDLYTLAADYVTAIAAAGGLPLIIPHDSDPKDFLDVIHGLILTGGGDVAASTYGAPDGGTSHDVNPAADEWESKLLRAARDRRLPVLGICRGMQIMAAGSGGRLDQENFRRARSSCNGKPRSSCSPGGAACGRDRPQQYTGPGLRTKQPERKHDPSPGCDQRRGLSSGGAMRCRAHRSNGNARRMAGAGRAVAPGKDANRGGNVRGAEAFSPLHFAGGGVCQNLKEHD